MIALLAGIVDQMGADSLVLDVNGVGYLVFCSKRTLSRVPGHGEPLKLLIETHVREDHIHLYGFVEEAERCWFRLLTTVQGVGARTALAILGALAPDALATAILAQDKAALTRADGVGPKLAAAHPGRVEGQGGGMSRAGAGAGRKCPAGATSDAVSALVNLGYQRSDAYGVIAEIARKLGPEARLDALIKAGLKELGR